MEPTPDRGQEQSIILEGEVEGFNIEFVKKALEADPNAKFVGLSFSVCIPPLIFGEISLENVPFLLTGTKFENFEQLLEYVKGNPLLQKEGVEPILKRLWDEGRIIQPRTMVEEGRSILFRNSAPFIATEDFKKYVEAKFYKIGRLLGNSELAEQIINKAENFLPKPTPKQNI
ncbi:MAG: hypothetical protein N2593_00955 [Patescibacteria group bacterium]|nr:hypothetical protein [Patescibacteria group bacterium]